MSDKEEYVEEVEYAEEVDAEPSFSLSVDGAVFLKNLIIFTASKGGFELNTYQHVTDLNSQLDTFLQPFLEKSARLQEEAAEKANAKQKKKSK